MSATKPGETESMETYEIAPGLEWLNGKRTKGAKTVKLTAAEAAFDLAQGRIWIKGSKPKVVAAVEPGEADPGKKS